MASPVFVPRDNAQQTTPAPSVTLLVVLPSRWKEFAGNLRAALGPSARRLAIEKSMGRLAPDWLAVSMTAHIVFMAALIWLVPVLPLSLPVVLDERPSQYKVIYYRTPSLPEMEDVPSRNSRPSPASAVAEAFHPTQTIRVSRGSALRTTVVDVPEHFLRRVTTPTANLLSLTAVPSAPAPVLEAPPAPVEIRKSTSKLARSASPAAPSAKPDLSRVGARNLPQLPSSKSAVSLALTPEPNPAAAVPPAMPKAHIDTVVQQAADLHQAAITKVPEQSLEQNPAGTVSTNEPPAIVISTNSADSVGVPAYGGPGSLAMSPKGHPVPDGGVPGTGDKTAAPGRGNGDRASAPGTGNAAGGPALGGSGSGTPASGGKGNAGSRTLSPGITVRGGVVSLDSFGPRTRPPDPDLKKSVDPARKPAPLIVVATGRSGGGLSKYGVFKSQQVYTVYVETNSGAAVLEFALHNPVNPSGEITPPDAIKAELPPAANRTGLVISCWLDSSGNVRDVRLLEGTSANVQAVVDAIRAWRCHPALMGGLPVAVDALIGIGRGH